MQNTQGKVEYPRGSGIVIRPVANKTNGQGYGRSFLVYVGRKVTRGGEQRRQFVTLEAAKDWAAETFNGIRAVGGRFVELEHADRDTVLRLRDAIQERGGQAQDVVDDVLAALRAIGASPVTLTACVAFALPRLAPAKIVTVAECAESLMAAKAGQVSAEYQRTTKIYMNRVTEAFGDLPVSHLDAVKINGLVSGLRKRDGGPLAPKTRALVLGAIRQLVRHAVSRGWLAKGVVDFEIVDTPRRGKAGAIAIFTPEELEALLTHAEPDLIPFLAIGAFAGLRSAEIERLDWREIDLVHGHIEVTARNSKTASRRLAPLPDNLKAWLAPLHRGTGRVFELSTTGGNLTMRLQSLARRAGLPGWKKNGLRHSAISNRVATIQNVSQVALECGNSPAVIFSAYRSVVTPAEAKRYFSIVPGPVAANVTPIPAVA